MSNKGLTFVILILVLLCVATFGLFYLKINPNMPLSQKIFGAPVLVENNTVVDTNLDTPFTDANLNENIVEATIPAVPNPNSITENGVTITPEGDQSETIMPNSNAVISTDTSNKEAALMPVVESIPNPITQVLKKGSRGSQVKLVQQFLIDNKYLTGKADGVYGAMTESAVRKFQAEYKINVDGVVDGKTRDTLNELLVQ